MKFSADEMLCDLTGWKYFSPSCDRKFPLFYYIT